MDTVNTPTTGAIRPNSPVFKAFEHSFDEEVGFIEKARAILRLLANDSQGGEFNSPVADVFLAISTVDTLLILAEEEHLQADQSFSEIKKEITSMGLGAAL